MTPSNPTAPALKMSLFGPMQVLVDGLPIPRLRSRKAQWLLAMLTLRHGRPVERDWLAGTLWPEVDQSRAFANLRPVISELRRALGSQGGRLQAPSRQTLLLDLDGAEVDVLTFDAAIDGRNRSALKQAAALYRGPLLEGCIEEWVHQERGQREQSCLKALVKLGDTEISSGDYVGAVGYFKHAASIDPFWDTARRGWMNALAKGGDSNAALQVYREFVQLLRSDPTVAPDESTSALYAKLRTEARHRAVGHVVVAAREAATPAVTGYLPHPLTDLVGREDEVNDVAARLRRSRLVTLTGVGGIGKGPKSGALILACCVRGQARRPGEKYGRHGITRTMGPKGRSSGSSQVFPIPFASRWVSGAAPALCCPCGTWR